MFPICFLFASYFSWLDWDFIRSRVSFNLPYGIVVSAWETRLVNILLIRVSLLLIPAISFSSCLCLRKSIILAAYLFAIINLLSPISSWTPSNELLLLTLRLDFLPIYFYFSECSLWAWLNFALITARVKFKRKKAPMKTRGTKKRNM